ncbi:MAG: glycosyltransferase family 2 protein [Blautia sp.]|nr:glycosyltransferase family 2 protein [Blautia sp.]
MKVDVIIPVYKPGNELFTLLDKLEHQTLPIQNIILMNTEKVYFDQLVQGMDLMGKYPNVVVRHITKKDFDHGGTRHQGVMLSDADLFVAMTQDAVPADRYLLEKLTARLSGRVAAAYARQLPTADCREAEKASRQFNYPPAPAVKSAEDIGKLGVKTFFCSNVCAAYRRDVYDALGGFIRHTIFNEDMIYAAVAVKAGYSIAYEADARVFHSHNYTNMQQLRRNFDLGVSQADHPEIFAEIPSESEGKRLVIETYTYLKDRKKTYLFPGFCVQCCFKYAGYLLGKHYRMLPRKWVLAITMNREYWG